jgi:hypothetical protein
MIAVLFSSPDIQYRDGASKTTTLRRETVRSTALGVRNDDMALRQKTKRTVVS